MMNQKFFLTLTPILTLAVLLFVSTIQADGLRVSLNQRSPSEWEDGAWSMKNRIETWNPAETAIIVCDMWDKHWCTTSTARFTELGIALNPVLIEARNKGITVVHAPSDCMDYYAEHPCRKEALKYKDDSLKSLAKGDKLPSEEKAVWPIDDSDGGCDTPGGGCKVHQAWTKVMDILTIQNGDIISDSGAEIGAYFKAKGIKNVILTGVATNMCVLGRSFGIRAMKRMEMNVVLMRDMTDVMYDPEKAPHVDHFSGLDLMVEYIETYVCPSIVSTDLTGKKQFKFADDKRKRIAFLAAEGEYHSNQKLPEFAHDLTLKNIHSDFALGVPLTEGPGRHNIENLQILDDADLMVLFVRRRALEPEKLAKIKNYVASGKPVFGLRTSSVAFDAKGKIDGLEQWTELDKDVWGGNYHGHLEHLKTGTDITLVPGMENHPVLKNVKPFNSLNWLYLNSPLHSEKAQVLLIGSNPDKPPEPVMWTNGSNIIYTSLGHWDDWKDENFRNLMLNTIDYLLVGSN